MKMNSFLFALFVLLGTLVAAEEKPSSLRTKSWFPDNPTLEFIPGKHIRAVIGVKNVAKAPVALYAAVGSLAFVHAPNNPIYNFSGIPYKMPELATDEEQIVEYPLSFPLNLPPRDFQFQITLVSKEGENYGQYIVFNETVSVAEVSKIIDTELLSVYAILLGIFAAAAYSAYTYAQNQGWVKKPKKTKTKTSASSTANDKSDWLKGTIADKNRKGKQI